ncbi:S41 family peptidase [Mucilaginibacter aquatilis]|nr:S41 family peptidase [Mucilaginibacter aquatilis]
MNRVLFVLISLLISRYALAQDYVADADKLAAIVQQLPSYKDQIKGDQKHLFDAIKQKAKQDILKAKDPYSRFYTLSQLILPLRDNHLYFSQNPPVDITIPSLKDTAFMNRYRGSVWFKQALSSKLNVDSLSKALSVAPADSVEGIYHYGDALSMALYRTTKRDSLVGVITGSKIKTWQPGQIAMVLKEYKPNRFKAYTLHILQKTWGLLLNEKLMHGMLTESHWKKFKNQPDFVNIQSTEPLFKFKNIDSGINYLRLGSFATSNKSLATSADFYNTIKDSLTAPTLIVDLRNNGGGGFKSSGKFLKLLEGYTKRGRIYALINNRTFSNAEQFAIKLSQLKNVTLLGETTNGTLAYGNNTGVTETLPSGEFKLYITDMRDDGNYLPYEGVGVKPAIMLNAKSDWILQAIKIINKK